MEPVVLDSVTLIEFIRVVLEEHNAPSTLVVCTSRDALMQQLLEHTSRWPKDGPECPLLARTIRLFSQSRTLQVAFCPSLEAVRAFFTQYQANDVTQLAARGESCGDRVPLLAVLNLLKVHKETSSWSAQGLGRTFSLAVEAAYRTGQRLIIAEALDWLEVGKQDMSSGQSSFEEPAMDLERDQEATAGLNTEGEVASPVDKSAWDEEIAILNVSTRSFGAGERGWVGRTVQARKVAARWFKFHKTDSRLHSS